MTQYSLLNERRKCHRCGKFTRPKYPCDEQCAKLPMRLTGITYRLECGHNSDELDGRMWCRQCAGGPRSQVDPTTRDLLKKAMDQADLLQGDQPVLMAELRKTLREVWHRIYYWTTECPPSTKSNPGSETPLSNESSDEDKIG